MVVCIFSLFRSDFFVSLPRVVPLRYDHDHEYPFDASNVPVL